MSAPAPQVMRNYVSQTGGAMGRGFATVLVLVLALGLTGCASSPPSERPARKSNVAIASGTAVELDNGLTVTVPSSWEATLTTYSEPSGDLQATQYLRLENWNATSGPKTLMVFSSEAATLPVSVLNEYGRDNFTPGPVDGPLQIFVGQPGTPFEPKRLMTAVSHIRGASTGILFYAGDPAEPQAAFDSVSQLFAIGGL